MTCIRNAMTYLGAKIGSKMASKKGSSEIVAVVILIVIVLVIGAVIFGPAIFDYFQDTILPGMNSKTNDILNYKP